MSEEASIDLDELRQSRIAQLEANLHELASRLTHLHWPSTEAEVTDCRKIRLKYLSRYYSFRPRIHALPKGFTVGFRYAVVGTTYTGTLLSPVEVAAGDRFHIRYNPEIPRRIILCAQTTVQEQSTLLLQMSRLPFWSFCFWLRFS